MVTKRYVGTKLIKAEPMTLGEYNELRGWTIPEDEDPSREGYKVIYPDGYVSWSPKEVFEAAYHPVLFPVKDAAETQTGHMVYPPVFPSEELSVAVAPDEDYGGAHRYQFMNSLGFSEGKAQYIESYQEIQFVQKNADGTMTPGLQSEQLIIALLDRTEKLNKKYPSAQNVEMIDGLLIYLEACKKRIEDRIARGVMGELKK